ncbi:NAD(P)-dependent oxidoreductase [Stutzerimonas chloritidismutans]|uniref:NAD(P)-dependent oxidoreductase n=1 Tax=Stutzerimonas chloritidismutans TaxID=203192 RepID=UPI003F167610
MKLNAIGLIGFGEAGGILAQDLAKLGLAVQVYDRLLDDPSARDELVAKAERLGVRLCDSAAEAVSGVPLVISAVTAGNALAVATTAAAALQPGQLFMDINSVAPATKQAAAEGIEAGGAGYIDAAVMAPVPPQRLKTPILLGGAAAVELSAELNALGFATRVVSEQVGVASAIKMCRSVMIKGLEALTTESLRTARHYGAESEVLASLHKSFPSMGWDGDLPHYLISRVAEHGRRRAEEMEEVAETVRAAGLEPHMSEAIVQTQRGLVEAIAALGLRYADLEPFDWTELDARLHDG